MPDHQNREGNDNKFNQINPRTTISASLLNLLKNRSMPFIHIKTISKETSNQPIGSDPSC